MASLGLRFGRSKSSGMVLPRIDSMLAGELAAPETGPDGGASAAPAAAAVTASAAPATERPIVHRASVQPLRVNSMHSKAPVRSLSLRRVESLGPQKLRKTRLASTSSESTRRLDEAFASPGSSPPASVALSLAERSTDADTRSTASWVGAGSVGGEGGRPVVAASAAEAAAGGGRRPRVSAHAQEHWHRAMVKLHASHLFVEAGETRRERLRSIEEDAKRTRILAENRDYVPPGCWRWWTSLLETWHRGYEAPTPIAEYLLLGDREDAQRRDLLISLGVTHVLNTAKQLPNYFEDDFLYHRVDVYDHEAEQLRPHYARAFEFIDDAREHGSVVFVHCVAGVSRSASTVIAYLVAREGMTLDNAIKLVRSRRPIINPNTGFRMELAQYEIATRGTSSVASSRDPFWNFQPWNSLRWKVPRDGAK